MISIRKFRVLFYPCGRDSDLGKRSGSLLREIRFFLTSRLYNL